MHKLPANVTQNQKGLTELQFSERVQRQRRLARARGREDSRRGGRDGDGLSEHVGDESRERDSDLLSSDGMENLKRFQLPDFVETLAEDEIRRSLVLLAADSVYKSLHRGGKTHEIVAVVVVLRHEKKMNENGIENVTKRIYYYLY